MLKMNTTPYTRLTVRNVGREDRRLAFGGGMLMLLLGLWRKSASTLLLVPAGLYLLYRAVTGHCYIYEYLGISTIAAEESLESNVPPAGVSPHDEVAESSWESFPTSDAPAWTMGRRD